jgi:ketosteroid isomerase-like protein
MSQQNVETVRQLYIWFASGEADRAFEVYDLDIEWDCTGTPWLTELGFDRIYRGHADLRGAFRGWLEAWASIDYRAEELIDLGDSVLAFVRVTAVGRSSGVEVGYDTPQLWTLEEGKVTRMRVFADRAEALQAAGLAE